MKSRVLRFALHGCTVEPGRDTSEMRLHATWLLHSCVQTLQLSDKSADDHAVLYRDMMTQWLDKHCPEVTVCRRPRPATPWFNTECHNARRKARTAGIGKQMKS